ncbi:MAG: hypothetical protein Q7S73_02580 [bacterium]|nr:hypothetical protein [bacterium]
MADPRFAPFVVVFVVSGSIFVMGFSLFVWKLVEKFKRIYWNYKIANWLYSLWEDAYRAGYNDKMLYRPYSFSENFIEQSSVVSEIIKNGYLEGYDDGIMQKGHKVNEYKYFRKEKYPPVWEYIQRLVKDSDEKIFRLKTLQ